MAVKLEQTEGEANLHAKLEQTGGEATAAKPEQTGDATPLKLGQTQGEATPEQTIGDTAAKPRLREAGIAVYMQEHEHELVVPCHARSVLYA